MAKNLLIINADDFGADKTTNDAVEQGFCKGILTSASIMPAWPSFKDACDRAKRLEIPCGVHLSLPKSKEYPTCLKWPAIPVGTHKRTTPLTPDELDAVACEFRTQVRRCYDAGLHLTHVDGHGFCVPGGHGEFNPVLEELVWEWRLPFIDYGKGPLTPRMGRFRVKATGWILPPQKHGTVQDLEHALAQHSQYGWFNVHVSTVELSKRGSALSLLMSQDATRLVKKHGWWLFPWKPKGTCGCRP